MLPLWTLPPWSQRRIEAKRKVFRETIISDAEYLLKYLPDKESIPGNIHYLAFGLAAYLYVREFELGCKELKRQTEKGNSDDRG